jgi:hypothetical protein
MRRLGATFAVAGFIFTWVEMITVVFGTTGDLCADPHGPNADDVTRLLWWSKFLLITQSISFGCTVCTTCAVVGGIVARHSSEAATELLLN